MVLGPDLALQLGVDVSVRLASECRRVKYGGTQNETARTQHQSPPISISSGGLFPWQLQVKPILPPCSAPQGGPGILSWHLQKLLSPLHSGKTATALRSEPRQEGTDGTLGQETWSVASPGLWSPIKGDSSGISLTHTYPAKGSPSSSRSIASALSSYHELPQSLRLSFSPHRRYFDSWNSSYLARGL